jgi:hypothetical protein
MSRSFCNIHLRQIGEENILVNASVSLWPMGPCDARLNKTQSRKRFPVDHRCSLRFRLQLDRTRFALERSHQLDFLSVFVNGGITSSAIKRMLVRRSS